MQRVGGGGLEVKNNMEEIDRFLVQSEYNGEGSWSGGYAHCYPPWTGTVDGLFNYPPVNNLILLPQHIYEHILFSTEDNQVI